MATLADLLKSKNPDLQKKAAEVSINVQKEQNPILIYADRSGRKGKVVTVIEKAADSEIEVEKIAKTLKNSIGTGGTVKYKTIELQGDHIQKAKSYFEKLGFSVSLKK